jgi:hypothetical protein
MLEQLEQLEHMKRWSLQNQDALTEEQLCKAFVSMCDDAIAKLESAQQERAADCFYCDENKPPANVSMTCCPVHNKESYGKIQSRACATR